MSPRTVRRLVVLAPLVLAGCFSRSLTVTTEPAGARVFIAHEEVGVSPVTVPFDWGGTREILILHESGETKYRPVRVLHDSENFLYDVFPFDVLSDLAPFAHSDDQSISITLEPSTEAELALQDPDAWSEAILGRAEVLRLRARDAQEMAPPAFPPRLPPLEKPPEAQR